jgi:hypothetical protein
VAHATCRNQIKTRIPEQTSAKEVIIRSVRG